MSTNNEGLLKVFISSTQRDLKIEREILMDQLNRSLSAVGMEIFGTDGRVTSQEVALLDEKTGLKNCDLVIFILTPHYGSIIEECKIPECNADCYFEKDPTKKISFTHCEYKFAKSKNIPCQAYIIDNEWDVVKKLKESKLDIFDWNVLIRIPEIRDHFAEHKDESHIRHLFSIKDEVLNFKDEVEKNHCPRFKSSEDITKITGHLADNIVKWYLEEKIQINDFCGRRNELKELLNKMDDSVEVHGVGGVGKTTLIHVALLIQILRGKKIITLGKLQSYSSGSGYKYFKEKCKQNLHEVIGDTITINDVIDALDLRDLSKVEGIPEKIAIISKTIEEENILFFIDDFHLADKNVLDLVKSSKGFVLSSKKLTGVARNEVHLSGIVESERNLLIDFISQRLGKSLSEEAKEKIKKITEGHPVSTEILVRNSERIDFKNLENIKPDALDFSNSNQVQEFIERLVDFIVTNKETFSLLKNLSIINTEIETDIDRKCLGKTFQNINFNLCFNELIDTGILEKKPHYEGAYQFSFKHIQDSLTEDKNEYYKKAADYYKNKIQLSKGNQEDIDSHVELLYYELKLGYDDKLLNKFFQLKTHVLPINYGYKRLIEIGKILEPVVPPEKFTQFYDYFGTLYSDINWYDDAENAFLISLSNSRKLASINRNKNTRYLVPILMSLGNLYLKLNRYQKAEKIFIEANDIRNKYPLQEPALQLNTIAGIQMLLGLAYEGLKKYDEAEQKHKFGLTTVSKIPRQYRYEINTTESALYTNLGNVYLITKNYKEAESAYKKAEKILKELASKKPDLFNIKYAGALNNLGALYCDLYKFYDSEKKYKESLKIIESLVVESVVNKNPDAFIPELARVQNNLGLVLTNLKKFDEAREVYKKSYDLIKGLYQNNEDAFWPEFINYTNNYGALFIELKEFDDALNLFNECLEILEKTNQKSSDEFLTLQSETENSLAITYSKLKRYPESEKHFFIASEKRKLLINNNYSAFLPSLTQTKTEFGFMLLKNTRYPESEIELKEALDNSRKLVKACPEAFLPALTKSLNHYGQLCYEMGRFEESDNMLKDALQKRRELVQKCKEAFLPELIETLNNYGMVCFELGKVNECQAALDEASDKAHELVDNYHGPYVSYLFDTLTNLEKVYKLNNSDKIDAISLEIKLLKETYNSKYFN